MFPIPSIRHFRAFTVREQDLFQEFWKLFSEKNAQVNLSAIRDEQGFWEKHIYDSLLGAPIIAEKAPKNIIDMGSGGGFPAIPLAILFPDILFTPVDSVQKKGKAIQDFANALGLTNVVVRCGRAEDLGREKQMREKYDMILARAFAKFSPLLEMTLPFLRQKGTLLAYRGPDNDAHDEALIDYFGGFCTQKHQGVLPSGEAREIWEIIKVEPTSSQFPRKVGIPKLEPIGVED
ncbi:MAG: 16S rRNA (guanine(527)-N(7))-methyltransferase RsmG [Candidatus Peregrinibacteria bacterium]